MMIKHSERSLTRKMFIVVILTMALTVHVMPAAAGSTSLHSDGNLNVQAATTLIFAAGADAYVDQRRPNTNYGSTVDLRVAAANSRSTESYLRFTVSGVSGTIQSARLRVYAAATSTTNGPALYAAANSWTETGITWNNRPARTSGLIDNKGAIAKNIWVEYDVAPVVTGNGTFNFVLAGDSSDDIRFSSRQGSNPPQLVIVVNPSTNTPTLTPTSLPGTTPTNTPGATMTPGSGSSLTFLSAADARVSEAAPTTNYGTDTTLHADGGSGTGQTSYIRFTVSGLNAPVQSVKLRVYCITNGTTNGPAAYLADNNWIESGSGAITWNSQPSLLSGALDNKGAIGTNAWVEYDVTTQVRADGTYTFALVADSTDGVVFSSREGTAAPQLVVTLGTASSTSTPIPTQTNSPTPIPTQTNSPTPIPTQTNSPTAVPSATASGDVVLVGAGDISTCSSNNDEATAQLLDTIPGTVFTAGDNAYDSGASSDYLNCYDPTWGRHKARTEPVPGNHDYVTSGAAGYFQYFNNIPAYYAYDLGAWRIYALNSEIDVSASGAEATWLQSDLAAHPNQCVLAYWHKARWSSGTTHGSTASMQTFWQILYNAGAELVVNGHEHNYERFDEMNASGAAASGGLREIVVGTGGIGLYGFGTPLATSQVRSSSTFGVLKLTLRSTGYDWQFVPIAGSTFTDSGSNSCH